MLVGTGSVEDFLKGRRMFEQLAELIASPRPVLGERAWKDAITDKQKMRIFMERAKQIGENEGNKVEEATDYEVLTFLMTASLAAPLNPIYQQIHAYLFRKAHPSEAEKIFNGDGFGQELDLQAKYELKRLKHTIWRRTNAKT